MPSATPPSLNGMFRCRMCGGLVSVGLRSQSKTSWPSCRPCVAQYARERRVRLGPEARRLENARKAARDRAMRKLARNYAAELDRLYVVECDAAGISR